MKSRRTLAIALGILATVQSASAQPFTEKALRKMEKTITLQHQERERAKRDLADTPANHGWLLRSKHFVFGMPQLADDRHNFTPADFTNERPGISVLVREGFVIGHFDRMSSPLWVCQRWTKADYYRMTQLAGQDRPWKEDLELPSYARVGTSYNGNTTKMDRGHMARRADNRAWGADSSRMGCKMSNSTPQHRLVNRFSSAWRELEDMIQEVVEEGSEIQVIWTISGAIFRDAVNPADETPETDFADAAAPASLIGDGFAVPDATYKIVGWFDESGHFQVRGYVFEQSDRDKNLATYLTPIKAIEERTGLNFFSTLNDSVEATIEAADNSDFWGAE